MLSLLCKSHHGEPLPHHHGIKGDLLNQAPAGHSRITEWQQRQLQPRVIFRGGQPPHLNATQVQADILVHVQQDAPMLLKASDFNLRTANTDLNNISLENLLAWHQICASVFAEICTSYTNQPQAALNHIKQ